MGITVIHCGWPAARFPSIPISVMSQEAGKALKTQCDTSHCFLLTDMAVQNFVGDAFRGATWVSLHNGGGVGW